MFWFFLQIGQRSFYKEDNPAAGIALLIGAGVIILAVLITGLLRNGLKTGGKSGSGGKAGFPLFAMHRIAKNYGLNREQKKALEFILKSNGVTDPERAVSIPSVLDKHFKRTFKQFEKIIGSEEEAQQKMALLFSVRNAIDIQHNIMQSPPSAQRITPGMSGNLSVNHDSYTIKVIAVRKDIILAESPKNENGTIIKFPKNTKAKLAFFVKSSKGFSLNCQILEMADTSYGPALQLSYTRETKTMVQRRFRRTNAALGCDFFMIKTEESKGRKPPKMTVDPRRMAGSVTDISIGGCAIKTHSTVPPGIRVKIDFYYARGAAPVSVLGQVLRINKSGISSSVIHVRFLKIPRKTMNTINSLVFEYGV